MRRPLGSGGALRAIAASGAALGPSGAWLYESESIGPSGLGIWIVVTLAIAGLAMGAYAVSRGVRAFGVLSLVVNAGVAALYGFPAVFLSLGGTR